MSRDQIAESLSSKDPAWFRQTQERGLESAAYRRGQGESMSGIASMTGSMRLPGMSRESTVEPEKQSSPVSESVRSFSPSRTDSIRGGSVRQSNYTNSTSISSSGGARPPIPNFASPSMEPPMSEASSQGKDTLFSRGMAMSPSQGRILPERLDRPASPTKGLGGFVQSAMLKRSDSVNKRWSAQPGTTLSRGNSIASNRSGYEGSRYGIPNLSAPREQLPATSSRETSPLASSRPTSSHGTATVAQTGKESDGAAPQTITEPTRHTSVFEIEPVKLVRSYEVLPSNLPKPDDDAKPTLVTRSSPPSSPGKRWSPTKSSWLENALNKPESPKPKMPPPQQPSWMTNLSQAKQQRGSVDLGKGNNFKEVPTGGLLRSPPMGIANKPPNIGGLPPGFSAGVAPKSRVNSDNRSSKASEKLNNKTQANDEGNSAPEPKPESPVVRKPSDQVSVEAESTTTASPKPVKTISAVGVGGNVDSPPRTAKPKPETPPKKDFRSNLKPRQVSGEKKTAEDPEFRNVFGKLKRTQTQNYVAPDELKDNILRGKAGLAVTGGPKKTERRDEFKESLLKQKEAMKAGPSSSIGRKTSTGDVSKDRTPTTPEALAKRNDLTKSDSNPNIPKKAGPVTIQQQSEGPTRFKALKEKPQPISSAGHQQEPVSPREQTSIKGMLGSNFNSSLAGVLSRGPAPLDNGTLSPQKVAQKDNYSNNGPRAQGPPPEAAEGPQLKHMTRSRARGPKRRLPTASAETKEENLQDLSEQSEASKSTITVNLGLESKPQDGTSSNVSTDPPPRALASISSNQRKTSQPQPPRKPSLNINKPEVSTPRPPNPKDTHIKTISPRLTPPPPTKPKVLSPEAERTQQLPTSSPATSNTHSGSLQRQNHEDSPIKAPGHTVDVRRLPQVESPLPSVKSAAASWVQDGRQERPTQLRARSPIKLPTRRDEEAAMKNAGLIPKEEAIIGLGINTVREAPLASAPAIHNLPTPPLASPKSPPIPAKKPASIVDRVVSSTGNGESVPQANGPPIPQPSEAGRLFAELFDESITTDVKVNIDTPVVLASRAPTSEPDKIRTLRKQLWEISSGGKLIPVPSAQSHILFEDSLYICHHVFGNLSGTRTTEVYLWCGDGVATSAVEDAQIFARKEAKDHGGKLIVLQQGKETVRFFQALGGIVITRRGQSDRAASRYMLCGRRYVGQIAFDEVDFFPYSLCKGFPYIVSSGTGKIHLWKGVGSGIDELGCARLIGMDLGLGGEITEIEDGKEHDGFWKLFPDPQPRNTSPSQSKHWQLKPSIEQYAVRLYQVDIEAPRPKSSGSFWGRRGSAPASTPTGEDWHAVIKELVPFAQSDVFYDGVFVLDTFFEVFVYVISFPYFPFLAATAATKNHMQG